MSLTIGEKLILSNPNYIPIKLFYQNTLFPLRVNKTYNVFDIIIKLKNKGSIDENYCIVPFVGDRIVRLTDSLVTLYHENKNKDDGYLHIKLIEEATFGNYF